MPRGGKRLGAGAKKGQKLARTIAKEEARLAFRLYVQAHAEEMHRAQIAHSKGLSYMVVRDKKAGKFLRVRKDMAEKLSPDEEVIEIWEKEPSTQAYTDLMNRYMDKPKEQAQEVDVKGDHTLTIRIEKPW